MYALVREYFIPGPTADIGCGSGRDTSWLTEYGFPTIGYDPSAGLLAHARQRYPKLDFRRSALPELDGVPDHAFVNVLCKTVIMHGRFYAAFDTGIVVSALSGANLLRHEELVSVSSGKKVHRIIARQG